MFIAGIGAGLSKGLIPGASMIAVALAALVIPAKESVGVLLVILLFGDILALTFYRKDANWQILRKLMPVVVLGVILGTVFLRLASNAVVQYVIGVALILLTLMQLAVTYLPKKEALPASGSARRISGIFYGTLSGFTTMVANAGSPPLTLYLLSRHIDVRTFLGTSTWFFFLVNVIKTPFSVYAGVLSTNTFSYALPLIPAVAIGAVLGYYLAKRIDQKVFNILAYVVTLGGGVVLLLA